MLFDSRQRAGQLLGEELQKKEVSADVVVGLARGGVVVAAEVARILKKPLSVMIVRKIGAPGSPEFAVGAMAEDTVWWDQETVRRFGLSEEWRKEQVEIKRKEVEEYRKQLGFGDSETVLSRVARWSATSIGDSQSIGLLNDRPGSKNSVGSNVKESSGGQFPRKKISSSLKYPPTSIVLVDDGAATGTSMMAAVQAIKKGLSFPYGKDSLFKTIVALPVASTDAAEKFRELADGMVLLEEGSFLSSVGQYYRDFSQVEWDEVRDLMKVSDTFKPLP